MVLTLSHVPVVDAGLVEHLERVHQKFYYTPRYHPSRECICCHVSRLDIHSYIFEKPPVSKLRCNEILRGFVQVVQIPSVRDWTFIITIISNLPSSTFPNFSSFYAKLQAGKFMASISTIWSFSMLVSGVMIRRHARSFSSSRHQHSSFL